MGEHCFQSQIAISNLVLCIPFAGSCLNGSVHAIIPGELLLCDQLCRETDLPPGCQWHDHGGRRSFGAEFYADLLCEMGVRAAVLVQPMASNIHADVAPDLGAELVADAFARRGIRVLRAPATDAGAASLDLSAQAAAAAAGGATALLCAAPDLGRAATLAAAWVAARHSLFPSPEAAAAWVGLAAGPAAAAGMDVAGLRAEWARRWGAPSSASPAAAPVFGGRQSAPGGCGRRSPLTAPASAAAARRRASIGCAEAAAAIPCGPACRDGGRCAEEANPAARAHTWRKGKGGPGGSKGKAAAFSHSCPALYSPASAPAAPAHGRSAGEGLPVGTAPRSGPAGGAGAPREVGRVSARRWWLGWLALALALAPLLAAAAVAGMGVALALALALAAAVVAGIRVVATLAPPGTLGGRPAGGWQAAWGGPGGHGKDGRAGRG